MIQVNDTEGFKSKATKGSLADFAEKEAERLDRRQFHYLLGVIGLIVLFGTTAFTDISLGKAGWFFLPAVVVLAALFSWTGGEVTKLRGRSATYKPLKTVHPKRDSFR